MSKALSSLSVGDKIEVPVLSAYQSRFGAKIVFKVADKNHSGYPANSVTLIAEKIIHLKQICPIAYIRLTRRLCGNGKKSKGGKTA